MRRTRAVALALTSVVLLQLPALLQAQVRPAQGGINLNFQDADLAYVFSALAQAAGVNIIHTNLPTRAVTIRTFRLSGSSFQASTCSPGTLTRKNRASAARSAGGVSNTAGSPPRS